MGTIYNALTHPSSSARLLRAGSHIFSDLYSSVPVRQRMVQGYGNGLDHMTEIQARLFEELAGLAEDEARSVEEVWNAAKTLRTLVAAEDTESLLSDDRFCPSPAMTNTRDPHWHLSSHVHSGWMEYFNAVFDALSLNLFHKMDKEETVLLTDYVRTVRAGENGLWALSIMLELTQGAFMMEEFKENKLVLGSRVQRKQSEAQRTLELRKSMWRRGQKIFSQLHDQEMTLPLEVVKEMVESHIRGERGSSS